MNNESESKYEVLYLEKIQIQSHIVKLNKTGKPSLTIYVQNSLICFSYQLFSQVLPLPLPYSAKVLNFENICISKAPLTRVSEDEDNKGENIIILDNDYDENLFLKVKWWQWRWWDQLLFLENYGYDYKNIFFPHKWQW